MINNEFIFGAVCTEAPLTQEMKARLLNARTLDVLFSSIVQNIRASQDIDRLKKHIFYGKKPIWDLQEKGSAAPSISARVTDPRTVRLLHAAIGLCTEAGEILEALSKHIYDDEELDIVNIIEEQGDIFWYLALMADASGASFESIMERNNAKLKARYPEKFTEAAAMTRDLGKERAALVGAPRDRIQSFRCNTIGRDNGALIIAVDPVGGYIHGYLDGSEKPIVWSLKDGTLSGSGNHKQELRMDSFHQFYRKEWAEGFKGASCNICNRPDCDNPNGKH